MQLRINTCGIHDCSPGWNWTTQKQGFPDYDIWAVFRGHGTLTPQTRHHTEYRLQKGAVLLLAPGVQYVAKHDPEHPLFVINVHFDFLDPQGQVIYPRDIAAKRVSDPEFFQTLLTRCVTAFHGNRFPEAAAFLEAALAEHAASDAPTDAPADKLWQQIVYEITQQIDLTAKPPTLAVFAEKYGYSERYLGKKFHQLCGVGFSDYLHNSRISKAKLLLRNTAEPIGKIAEQTGFYDACHFTRAFCRKVGVTPLAYRKNS